jgi:hypothetical protein
MFRLHCRVSGSCDGIAALAVGGATPLGEASAVVVPVIGWWAASVPHRSRMCRVTKEE